MPQTRHRGHSFLRFRRRHLMLGTIAVVGVWTCIPTLPASAEVLHTEMVVPGQVLVVTSAVVEAEVERPVYEITYFSIVQSPVAPSARLGLPFSAGHQGVDFLPGASTPVLNIADGVVTAVGERSGSLGVHVEIQHVVDGETVTSTYSHMLEGSMTLVVGQEVSRGTQVGLVGSTGASTGPHLHFQILNSAGTPINPLTWLQAHVNA